MSFSRIKSTFLRLPRSLQFIGLGSVLLALSTLLPWYEDVDTYHIGDTFYGVTGPAAFVGVVILGLAGLSLWLFSYRLFEKRVPKLPVREGIAHLFVAGESLFLTLVVISIYFHPKFGYNIALKETKFGILLAFVGSLTLLVGAYNRNKEETADSNDSGKLEPLIKMDNNEDQSAQQPYTRQHASVESRSFSFGEKKSAEESTEQKVPTQQSDSGSFKIRMDL